MTTVIEIQVWVLIGLFATLGSGLVALVLRTLDARFGVVDARFDALGAEMSARFDAVDNRFDAVDRRIDGLDRDVHMLVNRVVGGDPA